MERLDRPGHFGPLGDDVHLSCGDDLGHTRRINTLFGTTSAGRAARRDFARAWRMDSARLRWHYYVRLLRWEIPLLQSMLAFFASFAFSATPGKAGEVIKSVLLRTRYKTPLAEGVGVLLVERLGDLLAVIILATGGLVLLADAMIYFSLAVLLVGGTAVFVGNRSIYAPILSRMARIAKLSGPANKLLRLFDTSRTLLGPLPFLLGVGVAMIAWSCEGLAFHILIQSFGVRTQILTSCSIFGIATLVGALRNARRTGKFRGGHGFIAFPAGHAGSGRDTAGGGFPPLLALAGKFCGPDLYARLDAYG